MQQQQKQRQRSGKDWCRGQEAEANRQHRTSKSQVYHLHTNAHARTQGRRTHARTYALARPVTRRLVACAHLCPLGERISPRDGEPSEPSRGLRCAALRRPCPMSCPSALGMTCVLAAVSRPPRRPASLLEQGNEDAEEASGCIGPWLGVLGSLEADADEVADEGLDSICQWCRGRRRC